MNLLVLVHSCHFLLKQILCAPNSNWIKFEQNENIPSNSLLVTLGTESVYIGRSVVSPNKIYIGTIQAKEGMTVDFYGESTKLSDCEILVSGDVEPCVQQDVTNATKERDVSTEKNPENIQVQEEISLGVFNHATDDSPAETEIETDSGLAEYEELEEQSTYDEYGTSLEQIEERDENV